ncbi:MAG: hypothetical protein M3O34_18960, partial [Chloroflexota bacterium]|nr:hypothetical protein [Chloroflexota bacterium]
MVLPVLRLLLIVFLLGVGAGPALASAPAAATATPTPKRATATPTATPKPANATPKPATPTATQGPVSSRNSFISGTVFEDEDDNGDRGEDEDGVDDVTISLQPNSRSGDKRRTKTNRKGVYEFGDLAAGTYLLTLDPPDEYSATTSTRLEVKVDGQDGTRLADFGVIKEREEPTPVPRTSDSRVASNGGSAPSGGGSQVVTSAAQTGAPVLPLPPVAPPPPAPMPAATATPTVAQLLGVLTPIRGSHFVLEGRAADNGQVADFTAAGNVLQPGDLDMRLALNDGDLDVVIADQKPYWRPIADEEWHPITLAELRSWHGVLSALDVIGLPGMASSVREVRPGDLQELDGQIVQLYEFEVGPQPGRPSAAASGSGQHEPLDALYRVWVSPDDGLIQLAHIQAAVRSSRSDLAGTVEPARVDVWLRLSQHNAPFSIQAPQQIAQPASAQAAVPAEAAPAPPAAPVAPAPV